MKRLYVFFVAALLTAFLVGNNAMANTFSIMTASWYGPGFQGNLMANGETFDMNDPTIVAHKELPFGTKLKLTNPDNWESIVVTVQDRGPFVTGRQLDVSRAAAEKLDFLGTGVKTLIVEELQ